MKKTKEEILAAARLRAVKSGNWKPYTNLLIKFSKEK